MQVLKSHCAGLAYLKIFGWGIKEQLRRQITHKAQRFSWWARLGGIRVGGFYMFEHVFLSFPVYLFQELNSVPQALYLLCHILHQAKLSIYRKPHKCRHTHQSVVTSVWICRNKLMRSRTERGVRAWMWWCVRMMQSIYCIGFLGASRKPPSVPPRMIHYHCNVSKV